MSSLMHQSRTQYVYDFSRLDAVPEGPTSARVAAKRLLSGPTLATGKSSTVGAVLTGKHLIVTLGRQARGSGAELQRHAADSLAVDLSHALHGALERALLGDEAQELGAGFTIDTIPLAEAYLASHE